MPFTARTVHRVFGRLVALVALFAATQVAAQSRLPHVPFNEGSGPPIKRILVLDVPNPAKFTALDLGGGSAVAGAIGGAAKASRMEAVNRNLNAEMARQPAALGPALDTELDAALRKIGFDTLHMPGVQPKPGDRTTPPGYEDIRTDADAILSVRLTTVGYVSRVNIVTEYFPMTFAVVRLMSGDGKKLLMLSYVGYCTQLLKGDGIAELPCDPSVQPFKSDDELVAPGGRAPAYLLASVPPTAAAVANQLAKVLGK